MLRSLNLPKRLKKLLVLLLLALLLASVLLWLRVYREQVNRQKVDLIYQTIQTILGDYPDLPAGYGYTKLYYQEGNQEYMFFRNGQRQITAVRSADGQTLYYALGKSWVLDSEEVLTEVGVAEDPVEGIIREAVGKLLAEKDLSCTYHVADGIPLPKWVYPEEQYLRLHRSAHPEYTMEVMVREEADYGEYVRWNILGRDEAVVLYLFACPYMDTPNSDGADVLPGWGNLEGPVYAAVFELS